ANAKRASSYTAVGIFVGGTLGIGQGTVEAFARHTRGNAYIVLVRRNHAAATAVLASFPKPTLLHVTHEFVQCDLTFISNVPHNGG
ncbi:hypothetical protein B0H10DRAFT_1817088, partial [Mycena sp. CBHHK59/15]